MEPFAYLLLALSLLAVWTVCFIRRPDLRRKLLRVGVPGAIAGPLAEVWYARDYWHPPTIAHVWVFSLEDVLVGFAITGIGATIFQIIANRSDVPATTSREHVFRGIFLVSAVLLSAPSQAVGWNSDVLSIGLFFFAAFCIVLMRRDLLVPCLLSGLFLGLLVVPVYALVFGMLAPEFWDRYWMLKGTAFDILVLPGVPLLEVAWYVGWGCLAGVASPFARGAAFSLRIASTSTSFDQFVRKS